MGILPDRAKTGKKKKQANYGKMEKFGKKWKEIKYYLNEKMQCIDIVIPKMKYFN